LPWSANAGNIEKMLITEVKMSAIMTLLPVGLKHLACCIREFILIYLGMLDAGTTHWNCLIQA
jgi:hypothetical protein